MDMDAAFIAAAINATLSPSSSLSDSFSSHDQNTSSPAYRPYNERLETYLVPIVFLFIFVTGAIGNITLIHVLVKEKMLRSPSHLYILNLSLGDLIVILGTVPFVGTIYTVESWPHGLLVCKASEFIRDVSIGVSVMTLSAMSVDRYRAAFATTIRAVGRPYGPYSIASSLRTQTGAVMLMIWITSVILASPSAYFSYILKFPHPDGSGGEIAICYPFPDELGKWYPKTVVMAKCIILYIIPLTIIGCCYVSIATHLISKSQSSAPSALAAPSSHQQQSATTIRMQVAPAGMAPNTISPSNTADKDSGKKQGRVEVPIESSGFKRSRKKSQSRAKMILLLVIIFLVCFFPHHLFMIWFYYHPHSQSLYNDFWHVLRIVAFCLTFLNSTLNPLTLYLTSEQFKKLFNRYLWGCLLRSDAYPTDVSDPPTIPAESPPPPPDTGMKHADKNQNMNQRNGGKTCFYRETLFQTTTNPANGNEKGKDKDRFGGVFVGDSDEEKAEVGTECCLSCKEADSDSGQAAAEEEETAPGSELQGLLTGSHASGHSISSTTSMTESVAKRSSSARSHERRFSATTPASHRSRFCQSIPPSSDQRTKWTRKKSEVADIPPVLPTMIQSATSLGFDHSA